MPSRLQRSERRRHENICGKFLHNALVSTSNCTHTVTAQQLSFEQIVQLVYAAEDRVLKEVVRALKRSPISQPHTLGLRRSCSDGKARGNTISEKPRYGFALYWSKFWKPRYGFALYWSETIWDMHVFLNVTIATDGCNVIGRNNFLAQKLEAKIVSLASVHCHEHLFCLLLYCRRFGRYGYEIAKAL